LVPLAEVFSAALQDGKLLFVKVGIAGFILVDKLACFLSDLLNFLVGISEDVLGFFFFFECGLRLGSRCSSYIRMDTLANSLGEIA
jgi:hypothetical protein